MTLSTSEIVRIVGLGAPVLCIDTCSILDVMRDPTRATCTPAEARASMVILAAAETGTDLTILIAQQVDAELADHIGQVQKEAEDALSKFVAQAARIDSIATEHGATGTINTAHLKGHSSRARNVVNRWSAIGLRVPHDSQTTARAFARVTAARCPARKGKESMKDCVIVETYIEAARHLRAAGQTKPIVFASSNTGDFHGPSSTHLAPELATDFAKAAIEYAPNFGAARHHLGL